MITGGLDLGSLSVKAVLMVDDALVAWRVERAGLDKIATAQRIYNQILAQVGIDPDRVDGLIATGYGRTMVPFATGRVTEITCHAVGSTWFFPEVRTILDMGGQDCKAIRCNGQGQVQDFFFNDKCAAGTGRFMERLAQTLGVTLDEIGPRSLEPVEGPAPINHTCVVFAQMDAESLLRQGRPVNDILAGCCLAVEGRVAALLGQVGIEEELSISGGLAKNTGVVSRLEERLNLKTRICEEPQIVGAVGAAVLARRRLLKTRSAG